MKPTSEFCFCLILFSLEFVAGRKHFVNVTKLFLNYLHMTGF